MDSSTDDSITSSEDVTPRMTESFDNYSQQDVISNVNKDSQYVIQNTNMYHYDNFDNSMISYNGEQHEQEISIYDSDQYSKKHRYEMDTNHDSVYEHQNKRKKLNNGEVFDTNMSSGEKYIEENEVMDNAEVYANESKVPQKIQHMMERMGYKPGKGLGKDDQGRVEPIEAVKQRGRRGLGHYVPGLKEASLKWDPAEEEIKVMEDIKWLQNIHSVAPFKDMNLLRWIKYGPKKHTMDDETMFCNPNIIRQIIDSKTIFDRLDKAEMRKARTRSNPFETIRCVNFLNRAAVKMANIDRACDFMFTNPKNVDPNELLYFADVCAGPGGFSEYILSKKKWHAKGFGFTLKNENDFSLDDFFAGPCETFHPFYGSKGNGDVFDTQNQREFRSIVMGHTDGKGVHFMMSDGGFSVEGQENIQEILSKQLYLCQCLVALMIVRPGGHFVTKLFDLFTSFSVGLVYLMYHCFESISIFKPNTSRPANSERYLICKRKKKDTQMVMNYLSQINCLLSRRDDSNSDVIEIVPFNVLEEDTEFLKYLRDSNEILGRKQIVNLLKIAAFCEDSTLIESKQAEMRKECLKYWNLPDKTRVRPQISKPQDKVQEILGNSIGLLKCEVTKLKNDNVRNTILNQPYDWYCMPCCSGPYLEEDKLATFYLSLGRKQVYRYVKGKWRTAADKGIKIELPSNTLVYAELVNETKWTGTYFAKTRALHIIDAYMLGGEDVSKLYLSHRSNLTRKFCDALWKPAPNDYTCIRAKERFLLTPDIYRRLRITDQRVKLSSNIAFELTKNPLERDMTVNTTEYGEMNLQEPVQEPVYSAFNSVIFIRSIVKPWARHLSQKANEFYVFNALTRQSEYEVRNKLNNRPSDAVASFDQAFKERVVWSWPHDTNDTLNMNTLVQMINQTLLPRST
ncbi:PREDICTED: cap-specific mRNA (nucleoside-2'-O-)-methyltransferase 1 [Acromyrmex echinatior]|nr:PREDICTED: cap-specific mRNA (nucleoside-2'-O-)-methyltransferase 1 [Acromyrmex echinatior]